MSSTKKTKTRLDIPIVEQRRFIRHPLTLPLEYQVIEKGISVFSHEGPSTTINVSRGGLMFSAKHPLGLNAEIILKMPFKNKLFKVKARVAHCNKNPQTQLYEVGVCFYKFAQAFKVKLIEQIYLISEYRDLRSLQLGREISLEEASREWIKRYSERFKRLYW